MKRTNWFEIGIIVVMAALIFTPFCFRFSTDRPILIGEEAYYHARIADGLSNGNLHFDSLSFQGRPMIPLAFDWFLAFFSKLMGIYLAASLLPLILGLGTIILLVFASRSWGLPDDLRFFSLLLLILTPAFLFPFIYSTPYSLGLFLFSLALFSACFKRQWFSSIIFFLLPFVGLVHAFIALILAGVIYFRNKNVFPLMGAVLGMMLFIIYSSSHISFNIIHTSGALADHFVVSLGAKEGFSIFFLFLAVIGMIQSWSLKSRIYIFHIALFIFLAGAIFITPQINAYLSIGLCVLASYGLLTMFRLEWELKVIRDLTLLLIILSLLFSVTAYSSIIIIDSPSSSQVRAMEFLSHQEKGSVLSHSSRGFWIEYYSKMPAITDSLYEKAPELDARLNDTDVIFYSRSLTETKSRLTKYNISYIYVDGEMKGGLVWREEKQGLLFLFRDNSTFKRIYSSGDVEIWQVKKKSVPIYS